MNQNHEDHRITCDIKSFYEQDAKDYDLKRWISATGEYNDQIHKKITLSLSWPINQQWVLEVAIGTGRIAIELALRGANVVGIDISQAMLNQTKSKIQALGIYQKVKLVAGNAYTLPFAKGSFDKCVCINALNHIPNTRRVIQEISRVLKPGGILVINFTNLWSLYFPIGLIVNLRNRSWRNKVYTHWHTTSQIRRICKEANLEICEIQGMFYLPQRLPKILTLLFKKLDEKMRVSGRWIAPALFLKARKLSAWGNNDETTSPKLQGR